MFKKVLFIAALSGAIISSGALTTAHAATPSNDPTTIFNLSSLDETQEALVLEALAGLDYDWSQMKAALKKKTGKTHIPIKVVDIAAKWNACGLAWPNGLIQIDDQVIDPTWFKGVVLHEIGHMIDYFHLGPEKLRGKIAKVYGAPWSQIGHDFVNVALLLFSDDEIGTLTETQKLALRSLLS